MKPDQLHNLNAERLVIGAILTGKHYHEIKATGLKAEHFFGTREQIVFAAAETAADLGHPVTLETISDQMLADGSLFGDHFDGLDDLRKFAPDSLFFGVQASAKIIARLWRQRKLGTILADALALSQKHTADERDLAAKLYAPISDATALMRLATERESGADVIDDMSRTFEEIVGGRAPTGRRKLISWGVPCIDRTISPLCAAEGDHLIIIGAEPGVGKSSLARQMAHAELIAGGVVQCFLLETSFRQFVARCAGFDSGIPFKEGMEPGAFERWRAMMYDIQTFTRVAGESAENAKQRAFAAAMKKRADAHRSSLAYMREIVDKRLFANTQTADLNEIIAAARMNHRAAGRTDLLVIDYLQEVQHPNLSDLGRAEALGDTCRKLKMLAKEFDCPCLLISSLNRSKEPGAMPTRAALRASGDIEFAADRIIFLNKPTGQHDEATAARVIIRQDKARDLPQGEVETIYLKPLTKFVNP